jgi:hypothetical protein
VKSSKPAVVGAPARGFDALTALPAVNASTAARATEGTRSEVSVFVGDSEALRLSAAAFRGAWLWDAGDDTYLSIDSSVGRRGGHPLVTHQISTVWGLHQAQPAIEAAVPSAHATASR